MDPESETMSFPSLSVVSQGKRDFPRATFR